MIGEKFGLLTVLSREGSDKKRNAFWRCQCSCGATCVTAGYRLRNGETKSCGCLKSTRLAERNRSHGLSHTRLYTIWANMRARCERKNHPQHSDYGDRGIYVCSEWKSFEKFYSWSIENGYRPNLTIDRIENDGPYSPDNCRWATHDQQQENKRIRKDAKLNLRKAARIRNDPRRAADVAEEYGVSPSHVNRIKNGEQWKPNHKRT